MFNLAHVLIERNLQRPFAHCYVDNEGTWTYLHLAMNVKCMATWLIKNGLEPGDRVIITMPESFHYIVTFLAVIYVGGIAVPTNPNGRPETLEYQNDLIQPKMVFESPLHPHMYIEFDHAHWHPTQRNDPAFMLWTSGTTGHPKAVVHSHGGVEYGISIAHEQAKFTAEDRLYATSKLFYAFGMFFTVFSNIYAGACALIVPGLVLPQRVKGYIIEFKPTWFFTVPMIYSQLLSRTDIALLEAKCVSAGDRLPQVLIDRWKERTGQSLINLLGMTETLAILAWNFDGTPALGRPLPLYEFQLVDNQNNPVEPGQMGRLDVRGPSVALGYWRDDEWTKKTFETWVHSNDMCVEDPPGVYTHVGRAGDVIKTSARFINPGELEETLLHYPGVDQAAVVTRANKHGVNRIEAYIVLVPETTVTESTIKRHMLLHHERHACPRKIHIVTELPRTDSGKIQRHKLR